jgi:AraC-like DNA-binding protein
VPIVLAGIILVLNYRAPILVDESKGFHLVFFSDSSDNTGDSKIFSQSGSGGSISLEYAVGDTVNYAYVGGGYAAKDSAHCIDLGDYNRLTIAYDPFHTGNFSLELLFFVPGLSSFSKRGTHVYRLSDVTVNHRKNTVSIPLSKFATPTWWLIENQTNSDDVPQSLRQLSGVFCANHPLTPRRVKQQLAIRSFVFTRNLSMLFIECIAGCAVCYLIIFIVVILRKPKRIFVPYERIPLANNLDTDANLLETYLASHYHEADLSLDRVERGIGLTAIKIRALLSETHRTSFKQFVLDLRMNEARRLIRETDRQIVEIALAVGYPHVSTFNHLFKDATGMSPLEFRENKTP